jgi:hypothetical protein
MIIRCCLRRARWGATVAATALLAFTAVAAPVGAKTTTPTEGASGAVLTRPDVSARSAITFRPAAMTGRTADSAAAATVITCVASIDNVHRSSTTSLPNTHGQISCSHYTYSMAMNVYIYRAGAQVGSSGVLTNTGKTLIAGTANAPVCNTNTYRSDLGGYVVAPPGYTPANANLYATGPTITVTCATGCGSSAASAQTDQGEGPRPLGIKPSSLDNRPDC